MCPLFCISRRGCTYGLNNGTFQSHEGDVSGLVFESAHQGASRQCRFHFGDDLPPQDVHIAMFVWLDRISIVDNGALVRYREYSSGLNPSDEGNRN